MALIIFNNEFNKNMVQDMHFEGILFAIMPRIVIKFIINLLIKEKSH